MPDPPAPSILADFLADVTRLAFHIAGCAPDGAPLGVLVDHEGAGLALSAVSHGPGACAWQLGPLAPGCALALVSQETFELLRGARARDDGAFTCGAEVYRLRLFWNGIQLEARASAVASG